MLNAGKKVAMLVGAGALHATNVYDALLDHQPVLAIVGQQARNAWRDYQQELDLISMFKDVAGAYVARASSPAQVRRCRTAMGAQSAYSAPSRATI